MEKDMRGNAENKDYSISSIGKEPKPEWMETGYLRMQDIEAIPLEQRLNILERYQSGEYDRLGVLMTMEIFEGQDSFLGNDE